MWVPRVGLFESRMSVWVLGTLATIVGSNPGLAGVVSEVSSVHGTLGVRTGALQ